MNPTLGQAVSFLAGCCDGAVTKDDAGFNGSDTGFGRSIAQSPEDAWSPKARRIVWRMLRKYRKQLAGAGIDYDALPEPPAPEDVTYGRFVTVKDSRFVLCFPYDAGTVEAVKALKGRKFHGDEVPKVWSVPASVATAPEVLALIEAHQFEVTDAALERLHALVEEAEQQKVASRATDADVQVEGLGGTLMPFQRAGVAYALRARRCVFADEMGLGKTVQALATLLAADAFPALVICPASLKLNWQRESRKWLPKKIALVADPTAPGTFAADVVIMNYDVLARHDRSCRFPKEDPDANGCRGCALLVMLDRRDFKAIVLDEMHYVKNYKAKRTEAIKHLAKRRGIRLGLTGTPVLNRPQELISPLGILGRLDDMGGFWHFARHFCNAYKTSYGWDMSGAAHLEELNQRLRATCFVRRRKSEVLTELPAKQRAIVPVDITNRKEYEAAEADVISYCAGRAMKQEAFLKSLRGQPPEVQARMKREHYEDAAERAEQAEQLVRIEALKQVAAKGKAEAVQEWVESFLESGEKLVLFAHHRDFQRSLCALFPGCARLAGDDDSATRQANVDRFQTDPDCRLIVCSLVAGGVGITLTAASNVAFVEFGWNPAAHDQAEDRTHRIGQRDQVTAWYLAADRTIDTDILDLVEKKRAVVDAATDGQAGGRDTGILNELVERLTQKGGRRGE